MTEDELKQSTQVESFDTANGNDLAQLMGRHGARRWGVDHSFRQECVKAIRHAMGLAIKSGDSRAIVRTADALLKMESQNQADEHLQIKNDRADEGKPGEVTEIRVVREKLKEPDDDDS